MKFSPDGSLFVVGNGSLAEKFHLWATGKNKNAATWTKLGAPATMPTGAVLDAEFSPDGQYLAVSWGSGQMVIIYKTADWTTLAAPSPLPTDAYSLSWNSASNKLAVVGISTTAVYNVPTMTRVGNVSQISRAVAFHPTESNFVAGQGSTPFVRAFSDALVPLNPALPAASGAPFDGESMTFTDNGKKLVVASYAFPLSPVDKPITIYDWSSKTLLAQPTLTIKQGGHLSVNADQKTVAVHGTDAASARRISLIDTATQAETAVFTPALLTTGQVAFSPY